MILHTILRMVLKDNQIIPETISEFLDIFKAYLKKEKPAARAIIENIMSVVVTDLKYGRDALLNLNKVATI